MMKPYLFVILLVSLAAFPLAGVQAEQVIPKDVFEAAGLEKLTAEELATLEAWISGNREQSVAGTSLAVEDLPQGEDAFGVEQVEVRMAKILNSDIDRIETRIQGKLRGWGGGTYFYLQNGQVWKQIDNSNMRYNLDEAEVILFKGAMGTYFLKPKKLNSRVRVRRVK